MFETRKALVTQVGQALNNFVKLADGAVAEDVQESIRKDPYIIAWLWTFGKLTQDTELKSNSNDDPGFAAEATAEAIGHPIEVVTQGIAHWTKQGQSELALGEWDPFRDASEAYMNAQKGEALAQTDPLLKRMRQIAGIEEP